MGETAIKQLPTDFPAGYVAIVVCPDQQAASLRLCALVKEVADPVAGHLVVLREMTDGRAFLGCIVDAACWVRQWVEIWVQDISGLAGSLLTYRESLSNAVLDARWVEQAMALEQLDPHGVVRVGWESSHPAPVLLDLQAREPVVPRDAGSGEPWALCQDDALLAAKGLPAYSSSLHRYLCLKAAGAASPFIPLTENAPANADTRPSSELTDGKHGLVPFNPGGGLMLVRAFSPMRMDVFMDVLTGASWDGMSHGRGEIDPGGLAARLKAGGVGTAGAEGFLAAHEGRRGRLLEVLFIKLRLLHDAVEAAYATVRRLQRPFLGLTADSFSVRFDEPAAALPFFWTAKAILNNPSDAIPVVLPGSQSEYFLPSQRYIPPIYQPPVNVYTLGTGSARIPRIQSDPGGGIVIDVTFTTRAAIDPTPSDFLRLQLSLADTRIALYAKVCDEAAMAHGEWRLRTVPQPFEPGIMMKLRAAEGAEIRGVVFELLPVLSSPCDLYALAVLAVRLLLVSPSVTHAVAMDKILSLARQLAITPDESRPLADRIAELFRADARWVEHLGPQQLTREPTSPDEAFILVPSAVWFEVLAAIVRMIPAMGPDSACRSYGAAPVGTIHKVFEPSMAELQQQLRRVRSLIVVDWRVNREVQRVIARCAAELGASPAAPPDRN